LVVVVSHLPESRPKTIGCVGEFDTRLDLAEGVVKIILGIDTTRGAFLAMVILFGGGKNKAMLACGGFDVKGHAFLAIVLQLVVATAVAINLDIPYIEIESRIGEIFVPYEGVVVCDEAIR
jgi:hypothetical protein